MLYFPQLSTGAIAQLPLSSTQQTRTVSNTLPDGSVVTSPDATAGLISWTLSYEQLSQVEAAALQTFFDSVQGSFGTFTFVDPTANLLTWSEDFSQACWRGTDVLQYTSGATDPYGTTRATTVTNTTQAAEELSQSITGPSWFDYTFSLFVRADAPCTVSLTLSCNGASVSTSINVTSSWTTFSASGTLSVQTDGFTVGISVPAGTRIQTFGWQLEAQPAAGIYKRANEWGGVYPTCSFATDTLTLSATAMNQYSAQVQLRSAIA